MFEYLEKRGIPIELWNVGTELSNDFNEPIDEKFIEKYKEELRIIFGTYFNQPIVKLPPYIKWISFSQDFNHPLDYIESDTLSIIKLGSGFNQPINKLPPNVKHLNVSSNISLDFLPHTLLSLAVEFRFNLPIDNLPIGLKYLEISGDFNQPLDNLPDGLIYLMFSSSFSDKFSFPLNNLPNTLREFEFYCKKYPHTLDCLPNSIECFDFRYSDFDIKINKYPDNLVKIYYGSNYNKPIDNLPDSVREIIFQKHSRFNKKIKKLPNSLVKLVLGEKFYYPLCKLPNSVNTIIIYNKHYKFVKNLIKKYPNINIICNN